MAMPKYYCNGKPIGTVPLNNVDALDGQAGGSVGAVTILLGKFKVETMFFDNLADSFKEIRPFLLEGVEYTPEELIGEESWVGLCLFAQRHATLCLKHMATLPDFRLIEVFRKHDELSRFQLA